MACVVSRDVKAVESHQSLCYTAPDSQESDPQGRIPAGPLLNDEHNRATTPQPDDAASSESSELDPEVCDKIRKQVEFYFSDENLKKDSFLMKHIQRNKQGYVSLKLVSSFRKVKSLTKDWRVVVESVKRSQVLALNEDETKIRRVEPVAPVDYSHFARTVIVTKYASDAQETGALERMFGKCGEVRSLRVLQPGKAVPLDLKAARAKNLSIGSEPCVVVEYATENGAKRACAEWSAENCWRQQMKVELLDRTGVKGAKEQSKDKQKQSSDKKGQVDPHISRSKPRQVPESSRRKSSGRSRPSDSDWRKAEKEGSDKFSSSDNGLSDSGFSSKSPSESPKNSPAVLRRFFTDSHCWKAVDRQALTVLRQPLGPDGTRGFHRIKACA